MKTLAGTDFHNHSFISPDSKPVKNTTYLLPPQSGAPYSRSLSSVSCITTQLPEWALNIVIHFLMNIFDPVLELCRGGQGDEGWE